LRHAQAQGAGRRAVVGYQFAQRVDLAQDRLALLVDPQAHGGGLERLGVAVEQGGAEVFLEVLHPAGDGRLRQLQASAARLVDWQRMTATKASMSSIFIIGALGRTGKIWHQHHRTGG
jgi:hypothetical protein